MSRAHAQLIQQAKAAEQRGDLEEAVKLYLQANDAEEAARVYMTSGQFAKAGRILFRSVGVPLDRLGDADADKKKIAIRAGICLAKGGEAHNAAALFVAAGDKRRAIETLEKAGDTVAAARVRAQVDGGDPRMGQVSGQVAAAKYAAGLKHEQTGDLGAALAAYIQSKAFPDAARIARKLGKVADAGQFFEEAGMYYEAAVCWNDAKDLRRCYDAITRVTREHPRYRTCVLKAIEVAAQFGEITFEMDQFVARFVASGPENAQEIEALAVLGKLYETSSFHENARECYRKIVAVAPQHRAAQLLLELDNAARGSAMQYEKIVREDGNFRGDMPRQRAGAAPLPDLPDLPPLPGGGAAPRPIMPTPAMARTEYGMVQPYPQQPPGTGAYPQQPPGTGAYPQQPPGTGAYPQQAPGTGGFPQPGTGAYPHAPGYPPQQAYPQGYPQQPYPPPAPYPYGPPPQGYPPQAATPAQVPQGHAPAMAATAAVPEFPHAPPGQPARPQTMVQAKTAGSAPPATTPDAGAGAATGEHSTPARRDEPQQPIELVPGTIIADRYRLEKQIGQGGTAVVFRASDLELEEEVAIKVFTVVVDDPDLIRRFKQELSVTRQLSHPNIVRLHDIGTHRGFRFLTMEILQGTDLATVLQGGMPPMADSCKYLVQACSALQLAHERGVVHRDIKPENFFVTKQGILKVMDFGIAKKTQSQKLTQAGFIAGTPPYMSPEQISGFATVTHLADVYSLGIVAYEMFTGTLPFMHEEMMPLLLMHMTEAPEPPNKRNPKIPPGLNDLILRLLEKEPGMRVQSMKELAEELIRLRPIIDRVR